MADTLKRSPPLEEDGNPWQKPAEDEPPAKRARTAKLEGEAKTRTKRMFGALQATLSKFKEETSTSRMSDAQKRRHEVDERMQTKLRQEKEKTHFRTDWDKQSRQLKNDVYRKQDEKLQLIALYKTRQEAKIHLSHFLCTAYTPENAETTSMKPASHPHLPHAIAASNGPMAHPVYYLPFKLLEAQQKRIDEQLDSVRTEQTAEKQEVRRQIEQLDEEIEQAVKARDEHLATEPPSTVPEADQNGSADKDDDQAMD